MFRRVRRHRERRRYRCRVRKYPLCISSKVHLSVRSVFLYGCIHSISRSYWFPLSKYGAYAFVTRPKEGLERSVTFAILVVVSGKFAVLHVSSSHANALIPSSPTTNRGSVSRKKSTACSMISDGTCKAAPYTLIHVTTGPFSSPETKRRPSLTRGLILLGSSANERITLLTMRYFFSFTKWIRVEVNIISFL